MRSLLAALIVLSSSTTSRGVGNRVFEDLTALRRAGFGFSVVAAPARDAISIEVKVPGEFPVAEDTGTKPFARISLVRFSHEVEHGPMMIGAHSSLVPLESSESGDGHHLARVAVGLKEIEGSYLMVSFVHPGEGQWPLVVHVSLAGLVKQLESEPSAAAAESKSEDNEKAEPEPEGRSR